MIPHVDGGINLGAAAVDLLGLSDSCDVIVRVIDGLNLVDGHKRRGEIEWMIDQGQSIQLIVRITKDLPFGISHLRQITLSIVEIVIDDQITAGRFALNVLLLAIQLVVSELNQVTERIGLGELVADFVIKKGSAPTSDIHDDLKRKDRSQGHGTANDMPPSRALLFAWCMRLSKIVKTDVAYATALFTIGADFFNKLHKLPLLTYPAAPLIYTAFCKSLHLKVSFHPHLNQ